jgi:hypothetical protein
MNVVLSVCSLFTSLVLGLTCTHKYVVLVGATVVYFGTLLCETLLISDTASNSSSNRLESHLLPRRDQLLYLR